MSDVPNAALTGRERCTCGHTSYMHHRYMDFCYESNPTSPPDRCSCRSFVDVAGLVKAEKAASRWNP